MTDQRWPRVKALFQAAVERPVEERDAFLAVATGDDAALRREVESLLRADEQAGSFAERPAVDELADRPLQCGDRLGPYEIVELLGAGGMSEVYRARDPKLGRDVALKVLPPVFASDVDRLARLEARVLASLNHPHILTVHDVGDLDGRPYVVTEFIDGGTLKTWIRSENRRWQQSVELLVGVADGLAVAHAAGIVHRDVKPDNILISEHGYATLADFGLARLFEAVSGAPMTPATAGRTQPGLIVGTIAYMSPEQAAGKPADARSDVFSFGVVLYEALSGRQPFAGASDLEVLQRVQHQPAEPLGEEIPPALRMVVEKALEKDPAERFQSMRDMVVDLRRLARQGSDIRARATSHSRRRIALAAAALLVVVLGAAAIWRPRPATAVEAPRIRSLAVLPLQNLSRDPDEEFFSDGTTEALISNLAQIHDLDVISRTSAMRYKGTTKTAPEIGRELGVDAIVEGSVQRVGGRVRITAQLIRASTDKHLWAREYERNATDVLKLQAEVALTIAQEIQAHLTPEEARRLASARSISPEAHEAFLLGSYHTVKDNEADYRKAIEHFQRAIQLQPDYAVAYAWLAGTSMMFRNRGFTNDEEAMRTAAAKAIELDPNLAEAHAAMAWVMISDWDWAGAEQEARRAIALNPQLGDTALPFLQSITGRHVESIAAFEYCVKVDPLSTGAHHNLGLALFFARRYDDALSQYKRSIDLEPRNYAANLGLGATYVALEKPQEALAVLDRPEFRESAYIAEVYARLGRGHEALRVLNGLVKRGGGGDPQAVANAYFALGDKDRGFEWLTKAVDQRSGYVSAANVVPWYDGIRGDPRFKALVARLKLPN